MSKRKQPLRTVSKERQLLQAQQNLRGLRRGALPATLHAARTLVAGAELSGGLIAVNHLQPMECQSMQLSFRLRAWSAQPRKVQGGSCRSRAGGCKPPGWLNDSPSDGATVLPVMVTLQQPASQVQQCAAPHLGRQHAPGHHRLGSGADDGSVLHRRLCGAVPA